jgi:hypothetical protein
MMVARKRERFSLPRASGRCRFGQGTFAGASGNDEDAPIPDLRRLTPERRVRPTEAARFI